MSAFICETRKICTFASNLNQNLFEGFEVAEALAQIGKIWNLLPIQRVPYLVRMIVHIFHKPVRKPTGKALVIRILKVLALELLKVHAIIQNAPWKSVYTNVRVPAPSVVGTSLIARTTISKLMPSNTLIVRMSKRLHFHPHACLLHAACHIDVFLIQVFCVPAYWSST